MTTALEQWIKDQPELKNTILLKKNTVIGVVKTLQGALALHGDREFTIHGLRVLSNDRADFTYTLSEFILELTVDCEKHGDLPCFSHFDPDAMILHMVYFS